VTKSILILASILFLSHTAIGFASEVAARDYQEYCARCHGADGKGNGRDAGTIVGYRPTDLTRLSQNNGGKFPSQEIYDVIDGGKRVPGHSDWNSPMPLWGMNFQLQGKQYSPESEAEVKRKISALVKYIEALQGN
jgi:hypothetical protein